MRVKPPDVSFQLPDISAAIGLFAAVNSGALRHAAFESRGYWIEEAGDQPSVFCIGTNIMVTAENIEAKLVEIPTGTQVMIRHKGN